jgi:hypothetical protein
MLSLLISIDLTPLFLLQIIIHYIITFFINKTILFMHITMLTLMFLVFVKVNVNNNDFYLVNQSIKVSLAYVNLMNYLG